MNMVSSRLSRSRNGVLAETEIGEDKKRKKRKRRKRFHNRSSITFYIIYIYTCVPDRTEKRRSYIYIHTHHDRSAGPIYLLCARWKAGQERYHRPAWWVFRIEVRSDVSTGTADVMDVTCLRGCCCPGHTRCARGTANPFENHPPPRATDDAYLRTLPRPPHRPEFRPVYIMATVLYDTSACPTFQYVCIYIQNVVFSATAHLFTTTVWLTSPSNATTISAKQPPGGRARMYGVYILYYIL